MCRAEKKKKLRTKITKMANQKAKLNPNKSWVPKWVAKWVGTSKANGAQATQNINKNFRSDILIVFSTPLPLLSVFLSRRWHLAKYNMAFMSATCRKLLWIEGVKLEGMGYMTFFATASFPTHRSSPNFLRPFSCRESSFCFCSCCFLSRTLAFLFGVWQIRFLPWLFDERKVVHWAK